MWDILLPPGHVEYEMTNDIKAATQIVMKRNCVSGYVPLLTTWRALTMSE